MAESCHYPRFTISLLASISVALELVGSVLLLGFYNAASGFNKGKGVATEASSAERFSTFLANVPVRRTQEGDDSNASFRPSRNGQEWNIEKKRSRKRVQRNIVNAHVVLNCSSSSSDELDESDEHDELTDQDDTKVDKDILEDIDLSYNVQFRKLSRSQIGSRSSASA